MLKNIKNFSAFILKAVGGLLIFGGVLTSGFAIAQQNYGFAILIVGFYSILGGLVYLGGHALVKKGPLLDRKMENETRELRYVTGTLADGETIILAPKQSRWEYPAIFLAMALFSLLLSTIAPRGAAFVMLVITPMIMLSTWLTRYSTEQAMTSRNRVIVKTGFISRTTEQIDGRHLESANVEQTFMGRICGYGRIIFSGTGGKKLQWRIIAGVIEVNKKINDHIISKTLPPAF